MASTDYADLQGFQNQVYASFFEGLADKVDIFNANGNGAISLNAGSILGRQPERAFFSNVDPVSDRILTDSQAKSYNKGATATRKGFVVNKEANIADQISDLKLQGIDAMTLAMSRGQSIAEGIIKAALNVALSAFTGAISGIATLTTSDVASGSAETSTLTVQRLMAIKRKLGDAHEKIGAWFMHGAAYWDLINSMGSTPASATELAQGVIVDARWSSVIGAPIIPVDNSILVTAAASSPAAGRQTHILGIDRGGIEIKINQGVPMKTWENRDVSPVTLVTDMEFDIEGFVNGVSYTQGSFNPTLANLASSANWTQVAASVKDCAGVYGTVNTAT